MVDKEETETDWVEQLFPMKGSLIGTCVYFVVFFVYLLTGTDQIAYSRKTWYFVLFVTNVVCLGMIFYSLLVTIQVRFTAVQIQTFALLIYCLYVIVCFAQLFHVIKFSAFYETNDEKLGNVVKYTLFIPKVLY